MGNNTADSFKDKWQHNRTLVFNETLREGSDILNWILMRNGWQNVNELRSFLSMKKRILDAGCGNGRITALLQRYSPSLSTEIVGFDLVSADVARENLVNCSNVNILTKNLMNNLSELGFFDFIYCQEVLHHTEDPHKAFMNLCSLLEPDGEIAIYVYKKKAPVREFTDDYVRERISNLSYDDAMKISRQFAILGKMLSDLSIKIQVPDMDVLEISAGTYDIQRFIYHYFCKCFWNSDISFEENAVINYDWYHPQTCSRHTIQEIRNWFHEADLRITHEHVDYYGITMHGKAVSAR